MIKQIGAVRNVETFFFLRTKELKKDRRPLTDKLSERL